MMSVTSPRTSAAEHADQFAYGSAQEFLMDFAHLSSQHRFAISQQLVNVVESVPQRCGAS